MEQKPAGRGEYYWSPHLPSAVSESVQRNMPWQLLHARVVYDPKHDSFEDLEKTNPAS